MIQGYYDYLLLLSKYSDKNNKIISIGLNKQTTQDINTHPLLILLSMPNNIKQIKMYFNLCIKCQIGLKKEIVDKVIEIYESNETLSKHKQIIKEYLEKINEFE